MIILTKNTRRIVFRCLILIHEKELPDSSDKLFYVGNGYGCDDQRFNVSLGGALADKEFTR
ncbi:MAG: hypothetical protein ABF334_02450 [Akkermansiaceae bacterium]